MSRIESNPHKEIGNTVDPIEAKKNTLDLRPNIQFVLDHIGIYEKGIKALLARIPSKEAIDWAEKIEICDIENMVMPQVSPKDIHDIVARMPESLRKLSTLEYVLYNPNIPVPGFDELGNLDPKKIEVIPESDFPRPSDHPSRILVGQSNGEGIFPSPIPASVCEDERARWIYQVHVFLHEFFHTIDYKRRGEGVKDTVLLQTDGVEFSLGDWWKEFEDVLLLGEEPKSISMYASIYANDLTREVQGADPAKFTRAVAEQICETFVAYQLGIISNHEGWTDFQNESFGNRKQKELFETGKAKSANRKWELMDTLCRASVIQNDR